MLRLASLFLVVALVAFMFSFGFIANLAYSAAKIVFFVFLVLALVTFAGHLRNENGSSTRFEI